jgi:hypothetical protein
MEFQGTQNSQTILRQKNIGGGLILSNFKSCYKVTIIETVQYFHKNRYMDHWNKVEDAEINSYIMVN